MKGVFDTNILIDYLQGSVAARKLLAGFTDKAVSRITSIELLVGCKDAADEQTVKVLLAGFRVVELDAAVGEAAARIRRGPGKMKLPDAIILASAQCEGCDLITRNTKDFPLGMAGVLVPYTQP